MAEVKRLSPVSTLPVLVDSAHTVVDSGAILHYLDAAYPEAPALFPANLAGRVLALEAIALVDAVLNPVVDLGSRYFPLSNSDAWEPTVAERRARIEEALERLTLLSASLGVDGAWGAAEIAIVSMVLWFEGLPGRVGQNPAIARILGLGVTLPPALVAWATPHFARADVPAL